METKDHDETMGFIAREMIKDCMTARGYTLQ
jgi:hypothetical protein